MVARKPRGGDARGDRPARRRHLAVRLGDPEGFEVAFHGEYREIEPYDRLVSTEAYEGIPNPDENATVNTMTLDEDNGRTTVTILVQCPSPEVRDAMIESGMEAGMQDAFDLMEQVAISLR